MSRLGSEALPPGASAGLKPCRRLPNGESAQPPIPGGPGTYNGSGGTCKRQALPDFRQFPSVCRDRWFRPKLNPAAKPKLRECFRISMPSPISITLLPVMRLNGVHNSTPFPFTLSSGHNRLTGELVALPSLNRTFLPLPQTAAELLEGLLRSQLFAESIHGQIREQSRPFLKHPASEYAAALVQRKVLTNWQANELLAGRTRFYAGTFRLLGKWGTELQPPLFVAEQSGAQRLVFLEAIPRIPSSGAPGDGTSGGLAGKQHAQPPLRHPHVARCVQVQTTATHSLVAYEFHEAAWLGHVVSRKPPKQQHSAHLIIQLAAMLSALSREALIAFDPQRAVIDTEGHLRWLAGPRALVNDWAGDNSTSPSRLDLQLLAIRKFATWLGGPPEILRCPNLAEVTSILRPIATPWTEAFPKGTNPGTRATLNRMLRKGPSLKQIESFHAEQQHVLAPQQPQHPLQFTPPTGLTVQESTVRSATHSRRPQRRKKRSTSGGPTSPAERAGLRTKHSRQPPGQERNKTPLPSPVWSRPLLLTALIAVLATSMVTMQWVLRWPIPKAKAHIEARTDSSPSSEKSQ